MRLIWEFRRQFRSKPIFFWTAIFPLILAVLFFLVLRGAYTTTSEISIKVAIIEGDSKAQAELLEDVMEKILYQECPLFQISQLDKTQAEALLEEDELTGIIDLSNDDIKVILNKNGLSETILTEFVTSYQIQSKLIQTAMNQGMSAQEAASLLTSNSLIEMKEVSDRDPSSLHFFTLVGMVCMYGGFYGMRTMKTLGGNHSACGRRILCSGYPKSKLIFSNFIINNLILDIYVTIDILFMMFGLGVDFGAWPQYVFILAYLGCFAGNGFGLVLGGAFPKMDADMREGVLVAISMFMSFCAGMMNISVKQLVSQYAPVLQMVNPCYLITDGLYSLYYYGITERYFQNLSLLFVFGAVTTLISLFMLRRRQYDSL